MACAPLHQMYIWHTPPPPTTTTGLSTRQEISWAYTAIDEVLPTDVHMAMVIPALRYQTSPEQREAWLPLATSFQILGAYVQTELGHGSNVRALETTATFDKVRCAA